MEELLSWEGKLDSYILLMGRSKWKLALCKRFLSMLARMLQDLAMMEIDLNSLSFLTSSSKQSCHRPKLMLSRSNLFPILMLLIWHTGRESTPWSKRKIPSRGLLASNHCLRQLKQASPLHLRRSLSLYKTHRCSMMWFIRLKEAPRIILLASKYQTTKARWTDWKIGWSQRCWPSLYGAAILSVEGVLSLNPSICLLHLHLITYFSKLWLFQPLISLHSSSNSLLQVGFSISNLNKVFLLKLPTLRDSSFYRSWQLLASLAIRVPIQDRRLLGTSSNDMTPSS
jgi:hypothetical protein